MCARGASIGKLIERGITKKSPAVPQDKQPVAVWSSMCASGASIGKLIERGITKNPRPFLAPGIHSKFNFIRLSLTGLATLPAQPYGVCALPLHNLSLTGLAIFLSSV